MAGWFGLFDGKRQAALILAAGAVVLYAFHARSIADTWGGHVFILAGAAAMIVMIRWPAPMRPLAALGRRSYSLYLLHQNLGVAIIHYGKAAAVPDLAAVLLAGGVCIALAWLMFEFVERPGQQLVMALWRRASGGNSTLGHAT